MASFQWGALVLWVVALGAAAAPCGPGDCDTDALLQLQRRSPLERHLADGAAKGGPSDKVIAGPIEHSRDNKTSGGFFYIYNFSLGFDDSRAYWRRFGVDVPGPEAMKKCPTTGCPILFDFPGSGESVVSHRGWSKWYRYQDKAAAPYILVTMEGSPDSVMDPSRVLNGTSWNVLGWGAPTPVLQTGAKPVQPPNAQRDLPDPAARRGNPTGLPDDGDEEADGAGFSQEASAEVAGEQRLEAAGGGCSAQPDAGCVAPALYPWNSYQCFGTHLNRDPAACRYVEPGKGTKLGQITNANCASASGANDWDYVRSVLYYVTSRNSLCADCRGDKDHIYFSGQSMGGMSSLQFAAPQRDNKYNMGPYSPKAIAACSAAGGSNNDLNLMGKVPTLLMQGSRDTIAVPTVWAGYNRNDPYYAQEGFLPKSDRMQRMYLNDTLVGHAIQVSGLNVDVPKKEMKGRRINLLLMADLQTGGSFLEHYTSAAEQKGLLGCPDKFRGVPLTIDGNSYMWETFGTTLARVAGGVLDMSRLSYHFPSGFEDPARDIMLMCANATKTAGSQAEIQACTFKGGHTYPWVDTEPDVLHKFVWEHWFKGGTRV